MLNMTSVPKPVRGLRRSLPDPIRLSRRWRKRDAGFYTPRIRGLAMVMTTVTVEMEMDMETTRTRMKRFDHEGER